MSRQALGLTEILQILDDDRSVVDLRRYFGLDPGVLFTGSQFESLRGGGDRDGVRDVITAEDLIAVELLSVQVPPRIALNLLEGPLGRDLSLHLAPLPTNVDLGDERALPLVSPAGPADSAWRLLENCAGIGWVTAGKILARKRPRLIPVYDGVVRCALRTGPRFWTWLHGRLQADDAALAARLRELRDAAGLSESISVLRVLDVVIWMRHRQEHTEGRCVGIGDQPRVLPAGRRA
ncbi:DUF6308 family protein [Micromonospora sp. NBC_00389]|uniref:DUF6308 family protein n=1 Tax=Micromonospora sp. NBC_00389 TaxID=2903586 RepID=UPI002E1FD787